MVAPVSDLLGDMLRSSSRICGMNGDEEVEENDYFNELRSPEIITNHVFCDKIATWTTTSTPTRFP